MPRPTLSEVASVQWGNKIDWHLEFAQPHRPKGSFSKFVPAQTIDFPHGGITDKEISYGNRTIAIPQAAIQEKMTVVFVDDTYDTMLTYFEDWLEFLSKDGTATLSEAKRTIIYYKMDRSGKQAPRIYGVDVYPTGELKSTMGETSGERLVSVAFNVIAKTIK